MAVSLAVMRILEKEGGKPLVGPGQPRRRPFARRIFGAGGGRRAQLADAARLLKLRGQAMQKAVPVGVGAMAALLGIELEPAQEACKEAAQGEVVRRRQRQWRRPGRGLRPQGGRRARDRDRQGARRQARHAAAGHRALPLPADAARRRRDGRGAGEGDARDAARAAGRQCAARPRSPIRTTIKQRLVEQVTGLVRWRESVQYMKSQGVDSAGRVRRRQGAVRPGQAHRPAR